MTRPARTSLFAIVCAALAILAVALPLVGYWRGRAHVESLVSGQRLVSLGSQFSVSQLGTGRFLPSWSYRFDSTEEFLVTPLVIQIDLAGRVVATNPPDFVQLLHEQASTLALPSQP